MSSSFDASAIACWMDTQGLGEGPLTKITPLAGGTQNILLRFVRSGQTYVFRRPPEHLRKGSNEAMIRESVVLKAIESTPVPHPRLIAACEDIDQFGFAFYLMEEVEGFNATTGLPDLHSSSESVRHRMGLSLAEAAAVLGEQDYLALGLEGFGKPDGYLQRQVSRWQSQFEGYRTTEQWDGGDDFGALSTVAQWLEQRIPASFRAGIIHGDFHMANVMYQPDGPEIAAVIDWELATIGDPLLDLGWLLATWPDASEPYSWQPPVEPWTGFPSADELIAHYAQHSTRDLSELLWYRILACFKLAILLEGTYFRACVGKAPKDIGADLHAKAVRLIQRADYLIKREQQQ